MPTNSPSDRDRIEALLDPTRAPGRIDETDGYLDVLGSTDAKAEVGAPTSLAQRTMEHPLLAVIYERLWRPAGAIALMGPAHFRTEKAHAVEALRLHRSDKVLDVACGPGNFTRAYGESLDGEGIAIGVDVSVPMLGRAVRENRDECTIYLRADAATLPFADGVFDAVSCYAALYLIPHPFDVVGEMIRVLRPGGRISLMASAAARSRLLRPPQNTLLGLAGLHMFSPSAFTTVLAESGFTEIEQEFHGVAQYVSATKSTGQPAS